MSFIAFLSSLNSCLCSSLKSYRFLLMSVISDLMVFVLVFMFVALRFKVSVFVSKDLSTYFVLCWLVILILVLSYVHYLFWVLLPDTYCFGIILITGLAVRQIYFWSFVSVRYFYVCSWPLQKGNDRCNAISIKFSSSSYSPRGKCFFSFFDFDKTAVYIFW